MGLEFWLRHLQVTEREWQEESWRWQRREQELRREIAKGITPAVLETGAVLAAGDLQIYYSLCAFQKLRLEAAEKEEFVAVRRISECREELMAIRQAQKQLDRFVARREDLARRKRQSLQSEEMMALGISRQQISGEAVYRRGRAGFQSTRLPGRASGPGRPDPGHSPGEAGDLS
jgi:hypothetical protein